MTIATNIPSLVAAHEQPDTLRALARNSGQPALRASITATSTGAGAVTWRVQVVNADRRPCSGLFEMLVSVATTEDGASGGSQTLAVSSGVLLEVLDVNKALVVMTTANGRADIALTGGVSGTRYLRAFVRAVGDVSSAAAI